MTDLREHTTVNVDLTAEPPCEGTQHHLGTHGHDTGPAHYIFCAFCACGSLLVCKGRGTRLKVSGTRCVVHGIYLEPENVRLIEL